MKINKLELGKALSHVSCAVNPKHGYYSHVLLEANDEIRLTATDGNLFVRDNVDAGLIVEPGSVLIDAAKMGQLDRLNKPFDIEQDEKIAHIKCGRSKLKFPIIDATPFPRIEEPLGEPWLELNFSNVIEQVLFAAAEANSGRTDFESVSMQVAKDGFILVATNGYRISEIFCESDLTEFKPILLPAEALRQCKKILGSSEKHQVWIDGNQCKISFEKTLITMRLIDGTFPDYTVIIPKNPPSIFTVDVKELSESLKSTSIAAGDKHCLGMELEGNLLHLWTFSGTYQASEEIEVNGDPQKFKTGINSKFLIEALSQVKGGTVELQIPDPPASCLIVDTENRQHRQVIACMTPPPDLP